MHESLKFPPRELPSGAAAAYLRRRWTPTHVRLKRLRACVTAKQNGFWQIVS